ncbi:MAG: ATP-binding protein [Desulfopila sp.]|jgi:nitrogen-specific signal transduction histidine kinase/CheY-like chemotaxis protein|nr:ATP-binding protein [Desulfopila sp.]
MCKTGEATDSVRVQELEKQIEQLNDQLRDYQTMKEQLAQAQKRETLASLSGGIAHDFNNILHCILGYTEMAMLGKKNGSTDVEIFKQIQAIVARGRDLARQFLVYGRKSTHRSVELNVNTIVEEVESLLLRTMPRNIKIEHSLDSGIAFIRGDVGQCEQIVMNLCINAMDAMPHGGKLVITTENIDVTTTSPLHIQLGITSGSYVHISVADTGIGMSEEIVEKIFEPFFTTKQKDEGSGLGLSIVSTIVKSHGGYIDCMSIPDAGTTFHIYLPTVHSDYKEKTATEEKCFLGNAEGGEVILFVEDEESIRLIGKHFLESCGYTVLTAKNCEDGLDCYREQRVDLVVMDVGLPEMGGAEFLKSLQSINSEVKVLAISGYPASSGTIKALDLKEQEFLQKPFSREDLTRRVRVILDGALMPITQLGYQDDLRE